MSNYQEYLDNIFEENMEEGFFKTGAKLLPAFLLMFQLLAHNVEASPVHKDDIRIALIDMQESKSKAELDATSKKVLELVSSLKGEQRNKFVEMFKKAYKDTERKVS